MSLYIYVNGVITISAHAPAGFTLTDDVNDVLKDIRRDLVTGQHALLSDNLSSVCSTMEKRLSSSASQDDDAIELLYSAISNPELYSALH